MDANHAVPCAVCAKNSAPLANKDLRDFVTRFGIHFESFLSESKPDQRVHLDQVRTLLHAERHRDDLDDITRIFLQTAQTLICQMKRDALGASTTCRGSDAMNDMTAFIRDCIDTTENKNGAVVDGDGLQSQIKGGIICNNDNMDLNVRSGFISGKFQTSFISGDGQESLAIIEPCPE